MKASEKELLAANLRKEQAKPELARQASQRRTRKTGGDLKAVQHTVHTSRTNETAQRKEPERPPARRWQRAYGLPGMPPIPGYHSEWVRRDNRNRGDHENMIAHLQEGWEFARKEDYPQSVLPTQHLSDYGNVIGNDSSILMKIPDDLLAQRNDYYNTRRDKATREVNKPRPNSITHPAMPIVEDVNKETSGIYRDRVPVRKQQASVADD